ncbi:MAG: hypothetical protein JW966_06550 [Anaerolineae bacterium]|nr:hypothetical protein [Anaerolineae bacterium]
MRNNPQRLAWLTLISALALFCVSCVSVIVFARWLVFESPTQLNVTVVVGRGTVGLAEPGSSDEKAVRLPNQVGHRNTLSTDSVSQGYLEFSDPYSGDVIATVTLRSDSIVTLDTAQRPRFNLSDDPYAIRLKRISGRIEVWVSPSLDREIRLDIDSDLATLRIGESGEFMINSTPAYFEVFAREGSGTLVNHAGQTQHLASPAISTIYPDDPAIVSGQPAIDLLPNSTFVQADETEWPVEWTCAHYPSPDNPNGPPGQFRFTTFDGRSVVHIQRLEKDSGPGETGCQQFLNGQEGLDVTGFESIHLRVSMRVHYQKLSACGIAGSECPVMLYMRYVDQDGNERDWYHGFYAEYTPNVGRTKCDSCLEEHERITKDAWYIYESGDLLTDLPESQRPGSLLELKFYASGHEYDVMLNEVSLLAVEPVSDDMAAASE